MRTTASSTCFLRSRTMTLADAQAAPSRHDKVDRFIKSRAALASHNDYALALFEAVMKSANYGLTQKSIAAMLGTSTRKYQQAINCRVGSVAEFTRMLAIAESWPRRDSA